MDEIKIGKGEIFDITPTQYLFVNGENNGGYDFSDVTWSSDDPAIATAERLNSTQLTGRIVGVKAGMSTIVRMKHKSGAEIAVKVTVGEIPTKMSIQPDSYKLGVGEAIQLGTDVHVSLDGSWGKYNYATDNASVVTVNADGAITAVGKGTANITITARTVSAKLKVTVTDAPDSIQFVDGNGKTITKIDTYTGLEIKMPELVILPKGAVSKIKYVKGGSTYDGQTIPASFGGTITAETYNGKTASLSISRNSNSTFTTLMNAQKKNQEAEDKLLTKAQNFFSANGVFAKQVERFDEIKKEKIRQLNNVKNGINIATSLTGIDRDEVEQGFIDLIYGDFCKDLKKSRGSKLKDAKTAAKLVEAVNQLIYNSGTTYTYTSTKTKIVYTFKAKKIGSALGVQLAMGTITWGTNGSAEVIMTVEDDAAIKSFMDNLEDLAKAQIQNVITSSLTGGAQVMALSDVTDLMKEIYDSKGQRGMSLLIETIENISKPTAEKLAKLIMNDDSVFKINSDRELSWKKIKSDLTKKLVSLKYSNHDEFVGMLLGGTGILSESDLMELDAMLTELEGDTEFIRTLQQSMTNPEKMLSLLQGI